MMTGSASVTREGNDAFRNFLRGFLGEHEANVTHERLQLAGEAWLEAMGFDPSSFIVTTAAGVDNEPLYKFKLTITPKQVLPHYSAEFDNTWKPR